MANRIELLTRVYGSGMSPFLLCNLLARRAKQLANGQRVATWSGLINVAVTEFLEGRLLFEVNGQRLQPACDVQAAGPLEKGKHSRPGTIREGGGRKQQPVQEDSRFAWALWDRGVGRNGVSGAEGSGNERRRNERESLKCT